MAALGVQQAMRTSLCGRAALLGGLKPLLAARLLPRTTLPSGAGARCLLAGALG